MNVNKKFKILIFVLFAFSFNMWAETTPLYKINSVSYEIHGKTREYPLSRAVAIDTKLIFTNLPEFEKYLAKLQILFENERVLETVRIESVFLPETEEGLISVDLTVFTKDTWNLIVLPYPKYDSNDGFELQLKIKNYNFFGSMQELSGDLVYKQDTSGNPMLSSSINFGIPFQYKGYSIDWDNDFSIEIPLKSKPRFDISSGLTLEIPIAFTALSFGLEQGIVINDWNGDGIPYADDRLYFYELVSLGLPFPLYTFDYFGNLCWTVSASSNTKWALGGLTEDGLKGTGLSWGHGLSLGRVDWVGNFRKGLKSSIDNTYSWNTHTQGRINTSLEASIKGYHPIASFAGFSSYLEAFYNFNNNISDSSGKHLRGIFNSRIKTNTALLLNVDMPIRIMDVNFQEISGVSWTRYIGFEMHFSPFFDMALTKDSETERLFNFADGWYAGGFELIVFPKKMRSIYGRISAGFDLVELAQNGGKLSGLAKRDGKPISEFFLGIGLHY